MKKYVLALWAALTVALCGLRIYQLLVLTEPDTGFLRVFDASGWAFYGLLALGSAGLFLLSRLLLKKDGLPEAGVETREQGVALLALGLAILLESLCAILFPAEAVSEFPLVLRTLRDALGLLTAVYAVCWSVCLLTGKRFRAPAALTLLPALWLAMRALLFYLEARIAVTVPAIVLSILTTVFLSLWWMARARIQSDVDATKGIRLLTSLTPICLLLVIVSVLPASIAAFAAESGSPVSLSDVTTALFAPYIFLASSFTAGKSSAVALEE